MDETHYSSATETEHDPNEILTSDESDRETIRYGLKRNTYGRQKNAQKSSSSSADSSTENTEPPKISKGALVCTGSKTQQNTEAIVIKDNVQMNVEAKVDLVLIDADHFKFRSKSPKNREFELKSKFFNVGF